MEDRALPPVLPLPSVTGALDAAAAANGMPDDESADSDYVEAAGALGPDGNSSDEIDDDRQQTGAGNDDADDEEEYSTENTKVIQLTNYTCCAKRCIFGRTREMDLFIDSLDEMTKEMQHACILTSLSISVALTTKRKSRGKGLRARYTYVMPYLGNVCKQAFEACFDISGGSLNRLRKQVSTSIVPKKHGNMSNKNATSVDYTTLKAWFYPYATSIGHSVQARRKTRVKTDGHTHVQYRTDHVIVLPPSVTYEKLHQDYLAHLSAIQTTPSAVVTSRPRLPSEKTFRDYIKKSFPDIRLDSATPHNATKHYHHSHHHSHSTKPIIPAAAAPSSSSVSTVKKTSNM
ncbi:hypothetical protein H257_13732 [Aphanomyces astaci]|uniref:Uncharacterized protein n=2 Tax=Aphanomyces astaci TaxID=112090 RepID=W4FVM6_APHAT|nr:hypothetical protein H257_13732 [Aphanomyces astaci]ETV71006.1 hypothetical protein H257_13732 [Aphanomyces astaci]|eukprot:XP_009839669.1 hypothetical protein H257_13732 [Aphanomyces astaci]